MKVLKAKNIGHFNFGKYVVKVAILEDNSFVVCERDISLFIGGRSGSAYKRKSKDNSNFKHVCLSAPNLKQFINPQLEEKLSNRIKYSNPNRNSVIYGYEASTVTEICWVWQKAKEAGLLLKSQEQTYQRVNSFFRSLSTIGIISLIKEMSSLPINSPTNPSFWISLKTKCLSLLTNLHSIPESSSN